MYYLPRTLTLGTKAGTKFQAPRISQTRMDRSTATDVGRRRALPPGCRDVRQAKLKPLRFTYRVALRFPGT